MTVQDFKELSPFLAVIVSILALTVGPFLSGRVARKQAIDAMREKWIYAFRDCLAELVTEFDVLHESIPENGLSDIDEYDSIIKRLRILANKIRLMVNENEFTYVELLGAIEETIDMLVHGIGNYDKFHQLNESVKIMAQESIRSEWKKIVL